MCRTKLKSITISIPIASGQSGYFNVATKLCEVGIRVIADELEIDEKLLEEENNWFTVNLVGDEVTYTSFSPNTVDLQVTIHLQ